MSSQHLEISDSLAEYIRASSAPEPDYLKRLREETSRDPMGRMQITPELGQMLGMLVRLMSARRCIEVGVFTGYSSISVANALPPDGKVIACDVSKQWTAVARRYWAEAGVADKIDLRLAPALETLDALLAAGEAGRFDFAFIDADKANYANYFDRALELLRPGGLVVIDNVLWYGRVIDPKENDTDTVAIRAFNSKLRADPRVTVSMLPVGDGITLAYKKPAQ